MDYFYCVVCGNMCEMVENGGGQMYCCGQEMAKLKGNEDDSASKEKHVPIYWLEGNKVHVRVGEVDHPMEDSHYIKWITVKTNNGTYSKVLGPNEKPVACFTVNDGEQVKEVYAYCNIHGLWKK